MKKMKKLMIAVVAFMLVNGAVIAQGTPAKQDAKPKKQTEKTTTAKTQKTTTPEKSEKATKNEKAVKQQKTEKTEKPTAKPKKG
jgi:Ni/Co efflux regulator RcnB